MKIVHLCQWAWKTRKFGVVRGLAEEGKQRRKKGGWGQVGAFGSLPPSTPEQPASTWPVAVAMQKQKSETDD